MTEPLKIYVLKADADAGNAEFKRKKEMADKAEVALIHVTPEMLTMTRAQARDRKAYEAARDAARGVGQQVTFTNDAAPSQVGEGLKTRSHVVTDSTIYMTREATLDRALYQRLQSQAARDLKALKPIRSWNDLPEAEREGLEASLAAS